MRDEVVAPNDGQGEAADLVSASLFWDAKYFYDYFRHATLIVNAILLKAPLRVLRFCLQAYRCPRFVSVCGRTLRSILPSRSIVAGCTFADLWVRIYTLPGLDDLCRRHPRADIDMYYDDLGLTVRAPRAKVR